MSNEFLSELAQAILEKCNTFKGGNSILGYEKAASWGEEAAQRKGEKMKKSILKVPGGWNFSLD